MIKGIWVLRGQKHYFVPHKTPTLHTQSMQSMIATSSRAEPISPILISFDKNENMSVFGVSNSNL